MEQIKLTRTNKRPVVFSGEELLTFSTKEGHNSTRWQKVSVYRTESGKLVVGLGNITCWQGEYDHYSVETFANKEALVSWIEENCPELAEKVAREFGVVETI